MHLSDDDGVLGFFLRLAGVLVGAEAVLGLATLRRRPLGDALLSRRASGCRCGGAAWTGWDRHIAGA